MAIGHTYRQIERQNQTEKQRIRVENGGERNKERGLFRHLSRVKKSLNDPLEKCERKEP